MKSGYFGIGCFNMKNPINYGTLFRTAQLFGADFIFLIGKRFKAQCSDTMKSFKHLPLYEYKTFEDFEKNRPYGGQLVGIELTSEAVPLTEFKHPKQAVYLLGSEDNGIPEKYLKKCQYVIKIPFRDNSLNVSTSGSIVLYDRLSKKSQIAESATNINNTHSPNKTEGTTGTKSEGSIDSNRKIKPLTSNSSNVQEASP